MSMVHIIQPAVRIIAPFKKILSTINSFKNHKKDNRSLKNSLILLNDNDKI